MLRRLHQSGTTGHTIFICLAFIIILCCTGKAEAKKTVSVKKIVRIETFENCQDRPNTAEYFKHANYIDNVKLQRVKMDQVINADYVIHKPVRTVVGEVEIIRCETKEQTSCEYLMRFKLPDLCSKFLEKNQFYSPLIQAMSPTVKCPLNKPVYRIVNGTFSGEGTSSVLSSLPGSFDSYWGIKFSYKDDTNSKEASCLHLVFKAYQLRMKQ